MFDSDSNKDYCKDEYKPEHKIKKEETCVEINIFCEHGKKEPKDDCRKDY
jgi:hypothetical protein